jgi:hypothetical protein
LLPGSDAIIGAVREWLTVPTLARG